MDDEAEKTAAGGLSGAHTRGDLPGAGADQGAPRGLADLLAADIARMSAELGGDDAGQLDLLTGSLDVENEDAISLAANLVAAQRRGRGRPPGAANRRNVAVFDYLEALGHRDPAVTLSMIQSANTTALARLIGADGIEVLREQIKAAVALLPFKYAKRPTELTVNKRELHMFIAGNMGAVAAGEGGQGLSIFGGGKVIENQGDSETVTVRLGDDEPHEGE